MCSHTRCSGTLSLKAPARLVVIAHLVCDDCGEQVSELLAQSAEATAQLGVPRLVLPPLAA